MEQNKIRSHKVRRAAAREIALSLPGKLSIFDLEALTEFLLVEDIKNLYVDRRELVKSRVKATPEGRHYQKKQLEQINYLIYMLNKCLDVLESKIDNGEYSDVWRAIREHQLKVAANKLKYLEVLVKLVEEMLKDVDNDALELAKKMLEGEEFLENLEAHDANIRRVEGIPEDYGEEVAAIVEPQPEEIKEKKPNLNLN